MTPKVWSQTFCWQATNKSLGKFAPVNIAEMKFSKNSSYLLLQLREQSKAGTTSTNSDGLKNAVEMLSAASVCLEEEHLSVPVAPAHATLGKYSFCVYMWSGKDSSAVSRSLSLSTALQLHTSLSGDTEGKVVTELFRLAPSTTFAKLNPAKSRKLTKAQAQELVASIPSCFSHCELVHESLMHGNMDLFPEMRHRFLGKRKKGSAHKPSGHSPKVEKSKKTPRSSSGVPRLRLGEVDDDSGSSDASSSSRRHYRLLNSSPKKSPLTRPPTSRSKSKSLPGPLEKRSHSEKRAEKKEKKAKRSNSGRRSAGKRNLPNLQTTSTEPISTPRLNIPHLVDMKSERDRKSAKMHYFAHDCTKVTDTIYVGGAAVAQDKELLISNGITHILNAVGDLCENYFPDSFSYLRLYLIDNANEDILGMFYKCFDFIDAHTKNGERVYVHCHQGVSRSVAIVVGYLMLKNGTSYDNTLQFVKSKRGVARPNLGFTCQLLQWEKRLRGEGERPLLYRVAAHHKKRRDLPVAKCVEASIRSFDPRAVLILVLEKRVYIWVGSRCTQRGSWIEYSQHYISLLQEHEHAPSEIILVEEGNEPKDFIAAFLNDPTARTGGSSFTVACNSEFDPDYATPRFTPRNFISSSSSGALPHTGSGEDITVKGRTMSDPLEDEEEIEVHLFDFESGDEIPMFDSDDLYDERVFLLTVKLPGNSHIYSHVWVGEEYPLPDEYLDRLDDFADHVGEVVMGRLGFDDYSVILEVQGDESNEFWDGFKN